MMTCDDARRLMARAAFGSEPAALEAHLAQCDECRAAFDGQRAVAATLRARPPAAASPGFAARVRERIDADAAGGMLGLANWRAWGGALAPVAAGLTLAAWLGVGLEPANGTAGDAETFVAWTHTADEPRASVFLQPGTTSDVLLETVLTGVVPDGGGEPDVR